MSLESMMNIVQYLEEIFHHRSLSFHYGQEKFKIFKEKDKQTVVALSTELSKQILTSKHFVSFNYFDLGVKRLANKELPIHLLAEFYQENILFKEGSEHHQIKKSLHLGQEQLCHELDELTPRIILFFKKRKNIILTPLMFTRIFTRLCIGYLIAKLTTLPLKRVYQALSLRQNVFAIYFQPSRHKALAMVLNCLYQGSQPPKKNHPQWLNHLLAHHLIIMGMDPLIGIICANIVEQNKDSYAEAIYRYCPTSFVVRKCIKPIVIEELSFNVNDICYVSLLPSEHEASNRCPVSLPFGIGQHTCIGKQLSLAFLTLAEKIIKQVFSDHFKNKSLLAPSGAFLLFKDEMEPYKSKRYS